MWTMSRQLADAVEAEQATAASLALTYATRAPNDEVMDAERVWLHAHQTRHALESQLATGSLGLKLFAAQGIADYKTRIPTGHGLARAYL